MLQLPLDNDKTGFPDDGWAVLVASDTGQTVPVKDQGLDPAADGDGLPAPDELFPWTGRRGDGLTAYEEFRGFGVRKQHRRMHPNWKDLFLFVKEPDNVPYCGAGFLFGCGVTVHRVEADEHAARLVNGNGMGVLPGHHDQRLAFIDVVDRYGSPDTTYGETFSDPSTRWAGSPNETDRAEVYLDAFVDGAIVPPQGQRLTTVVAPETNDRLISGEATREFRFPDGSSPLELIVPLDRKARVVSTLAGADRYAELAYPFQDPGSTEYYVLLTEEHKDDQVRAVIGHEGGHYVHVEHYERWAIPPSNGGATLMLSGLLYPPPRVFGPADLGQVRVHASP
ncbi:MAG: M48 family metalloprotease [Candidatus Schekmanbacteria bacterium]|nr:M48 family metalloprotease [Candidatus Schekmanbacteria bacterium]